MMASPSVDGSVSVKGSRKHDALQSLTGGCCTGECGGREAEGEERGGEGRMWDIGMGRAGNWERMNTIHLADLVLW